MNALHMFYIRWGAVLAVATGLATLTVHHYREHLASFVPQEVASESPAGEIRVVGMVQSGTLTGNVSAGDATFTLTGQDASLPVAYQGPPPDNLRELKTLIAIGTWNASERVFKARDLGIVPNYGFVAGAYVVGLLPLAMFLFAMSRRVNLLYEEMKASRLYRED